MPMVEKNIADATAAEAVVREALENQYGSKLKSPFILSLFSAYTIFFHYFYWILFYL